MREYVLKISKKVKTMSRRCVAILQSNQGNGEMTGMLILILIAVVVGAVLLIAFGDQVKDMMSKIKDKIEDMFNYSW